MESASQRTKRILKWAAARQNALSPELQPQYYEEKVSKKTNIV